MAQIKLVKSGKWGEKATWSTGNVPTAKDDVILEGSFALELVTGEASCRSLTSNGYTGKFKHATAAVLLIGNSEAPEAVAHTIFKFTAGVVYERETGAEIRFVSSMATKGAREPEKIYFGTKKFGVISVKPPAGSYASYVLEEAVEGLNTSSTFALAGEAKELAFNTNGQKVTCSSFTCLAAAESIVLTLGASEITVNGTSGVVFMGPHEPAMTSAQAGTSVITVTDTGTGEKKVRPSGTEGARNTFHTLTVTGNNVMLEGECTLSGALKINTARATKAIKGTILKKELTITEGSLPAVAEEVEGTHIVAGTIVTKIVNEVTKIVELSKEATETVAVAEAITVYPAGARMEQTSHWTVAEFATNGKAGELARLEGGGGSGPEYIELKKTSGVVSVDYMRLSLSQVAGGAEWYAGAHSTQGAENVGWKFEIPPEKITGKASLLFVAKGASVSAVKVLGAGTLSFLPHVTTTSLATVKGASTLSFQPHATSTSLSPLKGTATLTFTPHAATTTKALVAAHTTLQFGSKLSSTSLTMVNGSGSVVFLARASTASKVSVSSQATFRFSAKLSSTSSSTISASTTVTFSPRASTTTKMPLSSQAALRFGAKSASTTSVTISAKPQLSFGALATSKTASPIAASTGIKFNAHAATSSLSPLSGKGSLLFKATATSSSNVSLTGHSPLVFSAQNTTSSRMPLAGSARVIFGSLSAVATILSIQGSSTLRFGAQGQIYVAAFAEASGLAGFSRPSSLAGISTPLQSASRDGRSRPHYDGGTSAPTQKIGRSRPHQEQ